MNKKINKILIANRGEIALRIIRACKELDKSSVAIFSEVDTDGVWVRKADECYPIIGDPIKAYLDYEKIISLAKKANCDAIHPGYGFLSENAEFAKACEDNDIIFIGPKPEHIALFGDKMASKIAMREIGVPVLAGTDKPILDKEEGAKIAIEIGFPVIIKAAFGGGGRGMRIVHKAMDFAQAFDSATNEAVKYFGKGEVFIEKYVENPRHIEIQIMADKYGNVIHLGERDCSIQRRHQKVIEITPSPKLNNNVRKARRALDEFYVEGFPTNIPLHREIVKDIDFIEGNLDTSYLNKKLEAFNMSGQNSLQKEQTKIDKIKSFIEKIKLNKLKTRN